MSKTLQIAIFIIFTVTILTPTQVKCQDQSTQASSSVSPSSTTTAPSNPFDSFVDSLQQFIEQFFNAVQQIGQSGNNENINNPSPNNNKNPDQETIATVPLQDSGSKLVTGLFSNNGIPPFNGFGQGLAALFPNLPNFQFPTFPPLTNLPRPTLPSIPQIPSIPTIPSIPNIPSIPSIPSIDKRQEDIIQKLQELSNAISNYQSGNKVQSN